ncbi:MAG TPA: hypothetical protein PKN56_16540 [Leptospiraceae bacterium]|nr:hypothetical protein [Leptospiraceae bacterium]HNO24068.1 hypothetical protein [Leptospiraceae bacterium]
MKFQTKDLFSAACHTGGPAAVKLLSVSLKKAVSVFCFSFLLNCLGTDSFGRFWDQAGTDKNLEGTWRETNGKAEYSVRTGGKYMKLTDAVSKEKRYFKILDYKGNRISLVLVRQDLKEESIEAEKKEGFIFPMEVKDREITAYAMNTKGGELLKKKVKGQDIKISPYGSVVFPELTLEVLDALISIPKDENYFEIGKFAKTE